MLSQVSPPKKSASSPSTQPTFGTRRRQGSRDPYGRTQTTDEETFGLVILRADSEVSVREIMEGDLAIKEQVMRAKLYPYRVAGRSKGQRAGLVHRAPTQEVS